MANVAIKDISPAEFEVSYGGISLGPLVRYTLQAVPEYDPARRTAICHKYVLRTTSYFYADDEVDMSATMADLRETLMQSGRKLVIEAIGIGDVNSRQNTPDIVWGPHPLEAVFKPLGGGVCWQVDWGCEFKINPSAGPSKLSGTGSKPLMMFNYETNYTHDRMGFTTRTVSCVLRIPQDGKSYLVTDIPEYYRSKVFIPVPKGYERVSNQQRVNAAQNELTLVAVDRQRQQEPFPTGIADASVRFSVSSSDALTNRFWVFGVAGRFETIPGFRKSLAQIKFFQIVFSHLTRIRNVTKGTILPVSIDMEHEPFGRTSSFRMQFSMTGSRPDDLFHPAILYSPLPDSNYDAWVSAKGDAGKSLTDIWKNGGQSNLSTVPIPIVDLSRDTRTAVLNSRVDVCPLGGTENLSPYSYFGCPDVSPENSWLAYEPVIQLARQEMISVNKRDAYMSFADGNGQGPRISLSSTKNLGVGSQYADPGDTITRHGAPEQRVIFRGKAVRVKHELAIPRLQAVEGVELTYLDSAEDVVPGPSIFGCPTTCARWIQIYRPKAYLKRVPPMPHPHIVYEGGFTPPAIQ